MRRPLAVLFVLLAASCTPAAGTPPPEATPRAPSSPSAAPVVVKLPDTPAGALVRDLVKALDAHDAEAIGKLLSERFEPRSFRRGLDAVRSMLTEESKQWKGLSFIEVEERDPSGLVAHLRTGSGDELSMIVRVGEQPPHRGIRFGLQMGPPPPPPQPKVTEAELPQALSAFTEKMVSAGRFSGTVTVAKDGKVLFAKAYGLADAEQKTPNTLDTPFNIASMGKMFTAVAIGQLLDQGKVALDEPIGKYLPDLPKDKREKVTVRHLLSHRGGIGDIFNEKFFTHRLELTSVAAYEALFVDEPLRFEPGSRFDYSNGGFILLGAILEKVTGQGFYDLVKERIFTPTGMTHTSYPLYNAAGISRGQTRQSDDGPPVPGAALHVNTGTLPARGSPAGGGYSTVGDLVLFGDALRKGALLKPETARQMFGDGVTGDYGMGFGVEGEGERRYFGHTGGAPGVSADLRVYPASGVIIAVLANLDPPSSSWVAMPAQDMMFGPIPPPK